MGNPSRIPTHTRAHACHLHMQESAVGNPRECFCQSAPSPPACVPRGLGGRRGTAAKSRRATPRKQGVPATGRAAPGLRFSMSKPRPSAHARTHSLTHPSTHAPGSYRLQVEAYDSTGVTFTTPKRTTHVLPPGFGSLLPLPLEKVTAMPCHATSLPPPPPAPRPCA